ncbi:Na+/H+ antiporter subunit G [Modicisalibacter xianhensis]|uniref:Multisubunit potassium/proton antiporter, PhaG subunit n=1 Tax=Modicisalibacter xianhensis TaxID=442341 RepID=A0A1I3DW11_9GAMM|nr:Na+/H+ antiporter subunit G [Halomonas xianhensis]SFH90875.1 multisubunit potassium/proton antiporter, PhaG subunit [Halomonas xianhensis]
MIGFYTVMEAVIAFFLVAGGTFALIGSLGLARLQDFYMRLHGPSKTTTLGVGCSLIGSMIYFSLTNHTLSLQELLITIFLFVTAPVSAHMLAKCALHQKLPHHDRTQGHPEEFDEELEDPDTGTPSSTPAP